MPKVESVVTVRTMAEVAWLASRVGRPMIDSQAEPSPPALRNFWQNLRQLQRSWTETLDSLSFTSENDIARLEIVAVQVFTTEMTARVWATILAGIDLQSGKEDLSRIVRNVVSGLLQVRNEVASKLLSLPVKDISKASELDRLRRRCDRWTDLLIGNVIGRNNLTEFAFDPERARDFAQESNDFELGSEPNPVDHLVAAGLRLGLLGQLPDIELEHPAFQGMIQSILGSLPMTAFHRDGSLIPRDPFPDLTPTSGQSRRTLSTDVLIPGITFAQMRQRFQ